MERALELGGHLGQVVGGVRRWVVERTFAWTTDRRRNARECERLAIHSESFVYWAGVLTRTRRLSKMG
ncbi:transposase [Glycomyces xiaoerkulensis]|uniref:transposase n=1 Tax=Glycomyces xiaoerkulensis TaxID=2038139 RepID=UPI000C2666C3|nr:transposase [Glycomyces xiaoerkulensis]